MKSKYLKVAVIFAIMLSFMFCGGKGDSDREIVKKSDLSDNTDYQNLLLITIDTLRADRIGVYSSKYAKTPNIDKIATQSAVFKRAFAHTPTTLPSHVNILTGTTPLYHGISDNAGFRLEKHFLTLAEVFKEKNYDTGAFVGAFPLDSRFGLDQGFDVYDDNYGTYNSLKFFYVERKAGDVIQIARKWIRERKNKWFAWIHLFDPHQPYLPPEPFKTTYAEDLYSGEVAYVDSQLGDLFDQLQKNGLLNKTIIVFTADHGEALGEKGEATHSYFAYNNTIHIPLFFRLPGVKGKVIRENVSHIDIFPTVCNIFDFKIPGHIQGESLMPIMEGKTVRDRKIYFESLSAHLGRGWAPLRGFIQKNTKYIDLPIQEVYDLSSDFSENTNLAENSDLRSLKGQLDKLTAGLAGKFKTKRAKKIDPNVKKKLESLGYISDSGSPKKQKYSRADDLKVKIKLQNKLDEANARFINREIKKSISIYKEIIEESPAFILAYIRLASVYQDMGDLPSAVKILQRGLIKNPDNKTLTPRLGIALVENNQVQKAIEILKQSVKFDDKDPETYNYLGIAYYRNGDFEKGLKCFAETLKLDKNYANAFNNIGSIYLTLFQKNRDEQMYIMAMDNFNKAINIDKNLYRAFNGRGAAYRFKNKINEALSDWQQSININPDYFEPYINISLTLLRIHRKSSALKYLQLAWDRFSKRISEKEKNYLMKLLKEARR